MSRSMRRSEPCGVGQRRQRGPRGQKDSRLNDPPEHAVPELILSDFGDQADTLAVQPFNLRVLATKRWFPVNRAKPLRV